MTYQEHIVAVVEPTKNGEGALELAKEVVGRGGRATVALLLTGQASEDIQAFAASEELDVNAARDIAADRLAGAYRQFVGGAPDSTEIIELHGSSRDFFAAAMRAGATEVVVPQRLTRVRQWRSQIERSSVPVVIAPPRAA